MATDPTLLRVDGLAELQRAFYNLNRDLGKGVREALEAGAEPVRQQAQSNVFEQVSGMRRGRVPWHHMRVGVTRSLVYVAPVQRGVKRTGDERKRRGAITIQVMAPPMHEAGDANRDQVFGQVLSEIDDLFREWARL